MLTRHVTAPAFVSLASIASAGASLPSKAMQGLAGNCFSPYLTAKKAALRLAVTGVRRKFYSLDTFSKTQSSPVTGHAANAGTDRRCEGAFNGDHAKQAAKVIVDALQSEGIVTLTAVPAFYAATDRTKLLAARQLNSRRIAVVHVGTRSGPDGIETFMKVERLTPSELSN